MANNALDRQTWRLNRVRMCKHLHPLCCRGKVKRIAVCRSSLALQGRSRRTR